jgi:hypothetical protein
MIFYTGIYTIATVLPCAANNTRDVKHDTLNPASLRKSYVYGCFAVLGAYRVAGSAGSECHRFACTLGLVRVMFIISAGDCC